MTGMEKVVWEGFTGLDKERKMRMRDAELKKRPMELNQGCTKEGNFPNVY